jgi:hypothetical protein
VASPTDIAVCRLFPDGDMWLPAKTPPDFGHGGRWRRLCIVTLLKASLLQLLLAWDAPGETADLGLLDRMMTTCAMPLSLLGASILEQTLARGGSQVERHADSRVDNAGSRRDGVAEARRMTRFKVRAQGGGAVWRHRQDRQS